MAPVAVTLTLSIRSLREHGACSLDRRIADLRRVLPEVADSDAVPLRVWWDLPSTSIPDRWWSLRPAEPALGARILAVRGACLAARRVLHLTNDRATAEQAIAAAEAWASDPTEERARAARAAAVAAYAALVDAADDASAYATRAAARAAAHAAYAAADAAADAAAYAAADAAADAAAYAAPAAAHAAAAGERGAQRADLDRLLAEVTP